ncbi:MAG: pirin family protein [Pseudomonadales bacterium]
MISLRRASERGHVDLGWLDSRHSFSFGNYYDPAHMGFAQLRVINEDRVAPGQGFAAHGHRDMEILSYVLEGALEHRDSLGNGSVIRPGELQRMSAGTGIRHSEFNASNETPVRFLQIWVQPERNGLQPGYEQRQFDDRELADQLRLVASRSGEAGSVTLHQHLNVYASRPRAGHVAAFAPAYGSAAPIWLQLIAGRLIVAGVQLGAGDGLGLEGLPESGRIAIEALDASHYLLFEFAPGASGRST